MGFPIDVVVFINEATETSIPLEIAGKIDNDDDFSVTIYSFFEPEGTTFGYDVCSLDATSQFDLRAYRRLYRRLREENPDVFHVHPNATGSIARILSTVADVPHVVTTEHNSHREFGHLKNLLNGGTNWLNERVICNSQSTANSFSSWENKLLKLVGTNKEVVYNGVDLERIKTSISRRPPLNYRISSLSEPPGDWFTKKPPSHHQISITIRRRLGRSRRNCRERSTKGIFRNPLPQPRNRG